MKTHPEIPALALIVGFIITMLTFTAMYAVDTPASRAMTACRNMGYTETDCQKFVQYTTCFTPLQ